MSAEEERIYRDARVEAAEDSREEIYNTIYELLKYFRVGESDIYIHAKNATEKIIKSIRNDE